MSLVLVEAAINSARYQRGGTAAWKARFVGIMELSSGEALFVEVNALRPEFALDGDSCGYYVIEGDSSADFSAEVKRIYTQSFATASPNEEFDADESQIPLDPNREQNR